LLASFVSCLLATGNIDQTIDILIEGSSNAIPVILRVLSAGVLTGVLIGTGISRSIALNMVNIFGKKQAMLALALSACILTCLGVFIDITVITLAPIALNIAKKLEFSRLSLLLALTGGGKCGNIISPNPNTISISNNLNIESTDLILYNIPSAFIGMIITVFLANKIKKLEDNFSHEHKEDEEVPNFFLSLLPVIFTLLLLFSKSITGIDFDPFVALPLGAFLGCLCLGKIKDFKHYLALGLNNVSFVILTLISVNAMANFIKLSDAKVALINLLNNLKVPDILFAPIAGSIFSLLTSSTSATANLTSIIFKENFLSSSIPVLTSAIILNSASTIFDHMPHGSFFHSTAQVFHLNIKQRFKIIFQESLIAIFLTITPIIIYLY